MLLRLIKREIEVIQLSYKKAGLTLTELLVVVAIIGIIALALIPAITQRTENARIATARAEVKELAMAEDTCAITTGYYIPLQVLDDIKFSRYVTDDSLDNESSTVFLIDPFFIYIESDGTTNTPTQTNLVNEDEEDRIYAQWDGPYTSFVKTLLSYEPDADTSFDYPLDPWKIPYRFFSPIGIIGSGADTTTNDLSAIRSNTSFSDGRITTDLPDYSRGRWMIMSLGRNQEFDDPDNLNDDIVHSFGLVVHETNYFVRRF